MKLTRVLARLVISVIGLTSGCTCGPKQESVRPVQIAPSDRAEERVALVYSPKYKISLAGLERLHPFDINKYERIVDRLIDDDLVRAQDIHQPRPVADDQLLLVHTREYLDTLRDSTAVATYLEAPALAILPGETLDRAVLAAFRQATGGTILAAALAIDHGVGINLAGGYHHAKPHVGEGFCVYNDIAIAIRELRQRRLIGRALVIDLDAHQGNGTAVIFADDDEVFTFSMHQGDIYPVPKEQSDLDVELAAGMHDSEYLRTLSEHWPRLLDEFAPDLVVYQTGCDVLDGDPLADLALTPDGLVHRDGMVIDECVRREVPVVMLLGGGYGPDAWQAQLASIASIIARHGLVRRENVD